MQTNVLPIHADPCCLNCHHSRDYPPDGKVTFTDIVIECDGQDCTSDTKWEAKVEDANCDMCVDAGDERGDLIR